MAREAQGRKGAPRGGGCGKGGAQVVMLDVAKDAESLIRASSVQSSAGIEAARNVVRLAGRKLKGSGGMGPRR